MPDRTEPGDIASLTLNDLDKLDGVMDDDKLNQDAGGELSDDVDEPMPGDDADDPEEEEEPES